MYPCDKNTSSLGTGSEGSGSVAWQAGFDYSGLAIQWDANHCDYKHTTLLHPKNLRRKTSLSVKSVSWRLTKLLWQTTAYLYIHYTRSNMIIYLESCLCSKSNILTLFLACFLEIS